MATNPEPPNSPKISIYTIFPIFSATPPAPHQLRNIFQQTHQLATHPILTYINADIIFLNDFPTIVQQVATQFPKFLLVGRRWNLNLTAPINFTN